MKFTGSTLTRLKASIRGREPHGLIPITKYIPPDLHLLGTKKLRDMPKASVFIPLVNRNGEASVLFTLRTTTVGSHKGQVSFPGGRREDGEDAVQCAIRELLEEIGGDKDDIEILGSCQSLYSITNVLVTPVIGFLKRDIGDLSHFTPEPNEVERIFTYSLPTLNSEGFKTYQKLERNGKAANFPTFGEVAVPEQRIWGLTGMILESVLNEIKEIDLD